MNDPEFTDPAWDLLKNARDVEPSPFFVRNVLREVRQYTSHKSPGARLLESVRMRCGTRALVAGGMACAALAVSFLVLLNHDSSTDTGAERSLGVTIYEQSDAFDPASEMAEVAYLGQLMAVVDPGQLDDDALADLFF